MSEETKVAKRYQWIKSDKTGNVVEVENEDGEWTYFKGGSRISTQLITEFLLPLEGDALPLTSDLNTINSTPLPQSSTIDVKATDVTPEKSPIAILFDKQKKNDKIKLEIEFPIQIPKVDIYNIIHASFEKKIVIDELKSYILNQLEEDDILDAIHNSIDNLIKDRYKGV
jgi:hypothetical protein